MEQPGLPSAQEERTQLLSQPEPRAHWGRRRRASALALDITGSELLRISSPVVFQSQNKKKGLWNFQWVLVIFYSCEVKIKIQPHSFLEVWLEAPEAAMLRFFSKRKPRGRADQKGYYQAQLERERSENQLNGVKKKRDKNVLPCRIILLDGADLSIDIHVSTSFLIFLKLR